MTLIEQAKQVEQRLRDGADGAQARGIYLDYIAPARAAADTIVALITELETAQKDAARWQLLQTHDDFAACQWMDTGHPFYGEEQWCFVTPEIIDAAIAAGGTK